MSEGVDPEVTLSTLHRDLGEVRSDLREVKTDMREVKALLTTRLPAPDWPGDMLRTLRENTQLSRENIQLLRENNRLSEERFAQLDVTLREQAIATHTIMRAVGEGQGRIVDSQRQLVETQRQLVETQRQLSADMRALIARIDALIRGRGDGSPSG